MLRSIMLLSCLILTGSALQQPATQNDTEHKLWLARRYNEAMSIQKGMTFADLKKVFEPDGGLQPLLPNQYVLKSCSMIKVDVQFDLPDDERSKTLPESLRKEHAGNSQYKYIPDNELKIKSISRPYLEYYHLD